MSRQRKWYYDIETGRRLPTSRRRYKPCPRTSKERREGIVSCYQLRRHGCDESWVVLGDKPGTWKLIPLEEQGRVLSQQRRLSIAKRYGVPASYVLLEDELANRKAARATAQPSGYLISLWSHAQANFKACVRIVATLLPLAGQS